MQIGITGTREGLNKSQYDNFYDLIDGFKYIKCWRYGDCLGVDIQTTLIVKDKYPCITIIQHPPILEKYRAFGPADVKFPPKPYGERDKDIVDNVDMLIAIPKQDNEILRSGTWQTVRYAKKKEMPIIFILPTKGLICD